MMAMALVSKVGTVHAVIDCDKARECIEHIENFYATFDSECESQDGRVHAPGWCVPNKKVDASALCSSVSASLEYLSGCAGAGGAVVPTNRGEDCILIVDTSLGITIDHSKSEIEEECEVSFPSR